MRLLIAAALSILVGCRESAYDYYGTHYDGKTDLGIRFRDDTNGGTLVPLSTPEELDTWYREVNECIGVWLDPMNSQLMIIRTFDLYHGSDVLAKFYPPTLIAYKPSTHQSVPIKHEFVHFLLLHTTGDQDNEHLSPFYEICGGTY